ncbi:MAG: hypothetical protein ACLFT0_12505 [Spirulinaceae cyanobacterium]
MNRIFFGGGVAAAAGDMPSAIAPLLFAGIAPGVNLVSVSTS